LQDYTDRRGEQDLQERLLNQAAKTLDFTPGFAEVEAAMDAQMSNLEAQLSQQGLSMDMYCSFMSTTPEALRADARPSAESAIRNQATIDKIVELEGLRADEKEIGDALAIICRQNDMTLEQLKPYYDAEFEQAVINSVLTSKVMRLIRDAAVITVTE
jgi:trigger factor